MPKLKIKPCPFCGSKVTVENIGADEEAYMFECTNDDCASATCFGDYSTDRATAIKNWNKRVAQCITNAKIGISTLKHIRLLISAYILNCYLASAERTRLNFKIMSLPLPPE